MELNKFIDHTQLKAEAGREAIEKLCSEAKQYHFMSVCINPTWIELAKQSLEDSEVKVCTVIGFPLGASTSTIKIAEAKDAVAKGADEVDMVMNIGAAKDGDWQKVEQEIREIVNAVPEMIIVKVIIETALLTREEIVKACKCAANAKADFVKTSTGFSHEGARVEDVKLMRETVGPHMGVKASGGVSNRKEAIEMIEAGATRIGASKGIKIVSEE
ncbi:deoxyribose-phosphate aldolase [Facklamia sp. DSM 111018]|uniref:Deoxyribose-phosphate aldolase n=1 Tax=Facklamia lactis TaxID=2749967 RepID=A0ABS0LP56_9LACT|nr:deoxyribose-phosphate aldolase [Facklamia lactis]MBG9980143.1 deoxyribose-phosphate aldolase [Facklamia lactis]MBG9985945.1 deoxyribose-phosphate aldolase [Facklamia lactis]